MPDGKLGHAELEIAGGLLYLAEEFPDIGFVAAVPGATPVSLVLTVPDVGDTVAKAMRAGGELTRPIEDSYGHRGATVVDPFGHRWMLQTPLSDVPAVSAPGDVGYAWLSVPSLDRAMAFYTAVLGWSYEPGSSPGRPAGQRADAAARPRRRRGPAGAVLQLRRGRRRRRGRAGARGRRHGDRPAGPAVRARRGLRGRPGRGLRPARGDRVRPPPAAERRDPRVTCPT